MHQRLDSLVKMVESKFLGKGFQEMKNQIQQVFQSQKKKAFQKSIQLVDYYHQQQKNKNQFDEHRQHEVDYPSRFGQKIINPDRFKQPGKRSSLNPIISALKIPQNYQFGPAYSPRNRLSYLGNQVYMEQDDLGSNKQLEFTISELKKFIVQKQEVIACLKLQNQILQQKLKQLQEEISRQIKNMEKESKNHITKISKSDQSRESFKITAISFGFLHEEMNILFDQLNMIIKNDNLDVYQQKENLRLNKILANDTQKFQIDPKIEKVYELSENKESCILSVIVKKMVHLRASFCRAIEIYLQELSQQIKLSESSVSFAQSGANSSLQSQIFDLQMGVIRNSSKQSGQSVSYRIFKQSNSSLILQGDEEVKEELVREDKGQTQMISQQKNQSDCSFSKVYDQAVQLYKQEQEIQFITQ